MGLVPFEYRNVHKQYLLIEPPNLTQRGASSSGSFVEVVRYFSVVSQIQARLGLGIILRSLCYPRAVFQLLQRLPEPAAPRAQSPHLAPKCHEASLKPPTAYAIVEPTVMCTVNLCTSPKAPSMYTIPTLGPKACKQDLLWAI